MNGYLVNPPDLRSGPPWRLVIDINEACNIQCSYCHIDALYGSRAKNSRILNPATVRQTIHDADEMKVFDITITGGEPMVAPTFGDLISVFRDTTFSSTQVITNLSLIHI